MATGSFNVKNLIGEGSVGRVNRAQFDDCKVLAVKKIHSSALPNQSSEDFIDAVSDISWVHHPNVTELVGYCSEHGQKLLLYEFQKNGSLYDFLHLGEEDNNSPLTWNTRVKIALGSARALGFSMEDLYPGCIAVASFVLMVLVGTSVIYCCVKRDFNARGLGERDTDYCGIGGDSTVVGTGKLYAPLGSIGGSGYGGGCGFVGVCGGGGGVGGCGGCSGGC